MIAKTYSGYSKITGLLTGSIYTMDAAAAACQETAEVALVEGAHDPLCRRVVQGPAGLEVVPWQPPRPADDELRTWAWDADAERWVAAPTDAAVAAQVRAERKRRMDACDWVTLRAYRTGQPVPDAWAEYLQALADITLQPGFPRSVVWPVEP